MPRRLYHPGYKPSHRPACAPCGGLCVGQAQSCLTGGRPPPRAPCPYTPHHGCGAAHADAAAPARYRPCPPVRASVGAGLPGYIPDGSCLSCDQSHRAEQCAGSCLCAETAHHQCASRWRRRPRSQAHFRAALPRVQARSARPMPSLPASVAPPIQSGICILALV